MPDQQRQVITRGRYIISNYINPLTDDARSVGYLASIYFLKGGEINKMRKFLKEVFMILPISLIGSMILILGTYTLKGIWFLIEKYTSLFKSKGDIFVVLSIIIMVVVIRNVYGKDTQED